MPDVIVSTARPIPNISKGLQYLEINQKYIDPMATDSETKTKPIDVTIDPHLLGIISLKNKYPTYILAAPPNPIKKIIQ